VGPFEYFPTRQKHLSGTMPYSLFDPMADALGPQIIASLSTIRRCAIDHAHPCATPSRSRGLSHALAGTFGK